MNGFHRFSRRLSAVLLVSLGAGAAQAQLNDTGQQTCYLIWEVKTDHVVPDLRDKNWRYTWYDSTAANPGTPAGGAGQHSDNCLDPDRGDTEKFTADVNTLACAVTFPVGAGPSPASCFPLSTTAKT